ncbi:SCO family protein [Sedimenticola thiotaurini]|uniref:SCO family protein n=1 Tax=Sedimenticola thiotaurini TaxID=1543721 RepID=UPI00069B4A5E|nr:SCO family protein [Sedimenticola thiotaurini]
MYQLYKYLLIATLLFTGSNAFGIGGDFTLTGSDGKPYSLSDSRGHVVVLSFGYTFCPDVCPTSLATISAALSSIGEAAEQIDPLFISVDPDRDTPEKLREYTHYFHPRMKGLTGTAEQIAEVAKRYHARFDFVGKGETENYTIDHTANLYVIDRNGKLAAVLPHGLPPQALADGLMSTLEQSDEQTIDK